MQTSPKRQDVDDGNQSWELSEDSGGLLRTQDDNRNDITHVFSEDGTLLTQTDASTGSAALDTTPAGGRLGRLLRYYMGNGGREVILQDADGTRWPARITGTRWHGKQRIWSFLSTERMLPEPIRSHGDAMYGGAKKGE